jgi:hypothetical protein
MIAICNIIRDNRELSLYLTEFLDPFRRPIGAIAPNKYAPQFPATSLDRYATARVHGWSLAHGFMPKTHHKRARTTENREVGWV